MPKTPKMRQLRQSCASPSGAPSASAVCASAPVSPPPLIGGGALEQRRFGLTDAALPEHTDAPLGRLLDIADRLDRLAPCSRNPFHFHEKKSELAHELREIAARWRR